jgi:hypothetical protein
MGNPMSDIEFFHWNDRLLATAPLDEDSKGELLGRGIPVILGLKFVEPFDSVALGGMDYWIFAKVEQTNLQLGFSRDGKLWVLEPGQEKTFVNTSVAAFARCARAFVSASETMERFEDVGDIKELERSTELLKEHLKLIDSPCMENSSNWWPQVVVSF